MIKSSEFINSLMRKCFFTLMILLLLSTASAGCWGVNGECDTACLFDSVTYDNYYLDTDECPSVCVTVPAYSFSGSCSPGEGDCYKKGGLSNFYENCRLRECSGGCTALMNPTVTCKLVCDSGFKCFTCKEDALESVNLYDTECSSSLIPDCTDRDIRYNQTLCSECLCTWVPAGKKAVASGLVGSYVNESIKCDWIDCFSNSDCAQEEFCSEGNCISCDVYSCYNKNCYGVTVLNDVGVEITCCGTDSDCMKGTYCSLSYCLDCVSVNNCLNPNCAGSVVTDSKGLSNKCCMINSDCDEGFKCPQGGGVCVSESWDHNVLAKSYNIADGFCYNNYKGYESVYGFVDADEDSDCCVNAGGAYSVYLPNEAGFNLNKVCCGDDNSLSNKNLVSSWVFDTPSTSVIDLKNKNHGLINNEKENTWSLGKNMLGYNYCLNKISVPDSSSLRPDSLSVSLWINIPEYCDYCEGSDCYVCVLFWYRESKEFIQSCDVNDFQYVIDNFVPIIPWVIKCETYPMNVDYNSLDSFVPGGLNVDKLYNTIIFNSYVNGEPICPLVSDLTYTFLSKSEGNSGYSFGLNQGRLFFKYANNVITNTEVITYGNWYHIVGTYDSLTSTMKFYVNSLLKGNSNVALSNSFSDLIIGPEPQNVYSHFLYDSYDTQYVYQNTYADYCGASLYGWDVTFDFNGVIDEVAVFNKTLSQYEINQLYNPQYVDNGAWYHNSCYYGVTFSSINNRPLSSTINVSDTYLNADNNIIACENYPVYGTWVGAGGEKNCCSKRYSDNYGDYSESWSISSGVCDHGTWVEGANCLTSASCYNSGQPICEGVVKKQETCVNNICVLTMSEVSKDCDAQCFTSAECNAGQTYPGSGVAFCDSNYKCRLTKDFAIINNLMGYECDCSTVSNTWVWCGIGSGGWSGTNDYPNICGEHYGSCSVHMSKDAVNCYYNPCGSYTVSFANPAGTVGSGGCSGGYENCNGGNDGCERECDDYAKSYYCNPGVSRFFNSVPHPNPPGEYVVCWPSDDASFVKMWL